MGWYQNFITQLLSTMDGSNLLRSWVECLCQNYMPHALLYDITSFVHCDLIVHFARHFWAAQFWIHAPGCTCNLTLTTRNLKPTSCRILRGPLLRLSTLKGRRGVLYGNKKILPAPSMSKSNLWTSQSPKGRTWGKIRNLGKEKRERRHKTSASSDHLSISTALISPTYRI